MGVIDPRKGGHQLLLESDAREAVVQKKSPLVSGGT